MTANSFRRGLEIAPPHYRTPSPPLRDFEPLSPGTAAWSETWSQPLQRATETARRNAEIFQPQSKNNTANSLDGEQSSMSNSASVAFEATTETEQPPKTVPSWSGRQFTIEDRPSKRARSEKLEGSVWQDEVSASGSADPQESDTRRLEAELLLNFSREACNKARSYSMTSATAHRPDTSLPHILVEQSPLASSGDLFSYDAYADGLHQATEHKKSAEKLGTITIDTIQHDRVDQDEEIQDAIGESTVGSPLARQPVRTTPTSKDEPTQHTIGAGPSTSEEQVSSTASAVGPSPVEKEKAGEHPPVQTFPQLSEIDNHATSRFLDGIEEAANADAAVPLDWTESTLGAAPVVKPVPSRQKQGDTPSVCAACNFTPNTLTAETENDSTSWICCDGCKSWFHFACAGFKTEREVRSVDKFRCRKCKPIHGSTTYVRKSARAHSAIDYAGLNEGIIKSSDENPEHHYIKPIKEGTIKFDPENFARMRPELVTADYFEKGDGMKEPIVIPADFNPRPRHIPNDDDLMDESQEMGDIHDTSILNHWLSEGFEYEQVPDCGQDSLGMVIPLDLTVRKVSELYGPEEKIEVIDVKSQNGEDKKWNMKRWVDYYEAQGSKPVRNVISLEVSQSKLGRLIKRPQVVRDLDLQDSVWPSDLITKGDFPKVQFYCLMSVADCFTDFHIDFGGSSVYYHILKGKKTFFFIPPHEKHLKKYEEWCNSPAQNWTFLGDQTKECYRVDLSEGDTMLIPAGWIHAVWTPEDSLVIGGNFLTRMHYAMQIRITQIEKATHVARKFRYPYFQKVMWYAAMRYLEDDPLPESARATLGQGQKFHREYPTYLDFDGHGPDSIAGSESYHARYYSKAELDGLPEIARFLQRTALIASGSITEGITTEVRNAVRRSIPKGCGEPFEMAKKFANWVAWKRGNENIPHWAYPDYVPENNGAEAAEKKLSAKAIKKLDRDAALQAWRIAPDRQSTRARTQPQNFLAEISGQSPSGQSTKNSTPTPQSENAGNTMKRKADSTPSKSVALDETSTPTKKQRTSSGQKQSASRRPACEACRKGRRACKHRDDPPVQINGAPQVASQASGEIASTPIKANLTLSTIPNTSTLISNNTEIQLINNLQHNNVDGRPRSQAGQRGSDAHVNKSSGSIPNGEAHPTPPKSSGRSKACPDCRKSKRRCVHDEFGNEDPAKLEQAVIPRPAAKKKRPSGEVAEASVVPSKARKSSDLSMEMNYLKDAEPAQPIEIADPEPQVEAEQVDRQEVQQPVDECVIDPRLEAMTVEMNMAHENGITDQDHGGMTDNHDVQSTALPSVFNPEDEVNLIATSPMSDVKMEHQLEQDGLPSSSNLSHQVASSLVSPPESTHTDAEQTPPAAAKSRGITPPATSSSSRHSSRPAKHGQRYTPESGPVRRASVSSTANANGRESVSPTASLEQTPMHKRTKSRVNSQTNADEESLRLIRVLQAEDMGLRRRGRGS